MIKVRKLVLGFFIVLLSACAVIPETKLSEYLNVTDADIYFVPFGPMSNDYLLDLVSYYERTFPLKFGVTAQLKFRKEMYTPSRKQFIADELIYYISKDHSYNNAIYIGVTHLDMYLFNHKWKFAYSKRVGGNLAVISSARVSRIPQNVPLNIDKVLPGTRKMITKTIGILHYKKPVNDNPESVLYGRVLGLDDLDKIREETLFSDILNKKI